MNKMHSDRFRRESLLNKVVSAEEAARLIENGMTVGMSGFTRAGETKAVPWPYRSTFERNGGIASQPANRSD